MHDGMMETAVFFVNGNTLDNIIASAHVPFTT